MSASHQRTITISGRCASNKRERMLGFRRISTILKPEKASTWNLLWRMADCRREALSHEPDPGDDPMSDGCLSLTRPINPFNRSTTNTAGIGIVEGKRLEGDFNAMHFSFWGDGFAKTEGEESDDDNEGCSDMQRSREESSIGLPQRYSMFWIWIRTVCAFSSLSVHTILPEQNEDLAVWNISTLKRRRKKISKHKYKKRMKLLSRRTKKNKKIK